MMSKLCFHEFDVDIGKCLGLRNGGLIVVRNTRYQRCFLKIDLH